MECEYYDSSFTDKEKQQSKVLKVFCKLNNIVCKSKLKYYKEARDCLHQGNIGNLATMKAMIPIKIPILAKVLRFELMGFWKRRLRNKRKRKRNFCYFKRRGRSKIVIFESGEMESGYEFKEEGVLRWRKDVAKVEFMIGGERGF
ncbi:unnamed protein product [Dovyalis caffra]|uniref:Uncharacterized protein n=1 Tax=Dovyalis caffra TaxID=77055 RepID=A0AAV1RJH9_9ROSI|nr:unnamed protein product [Dovyalis caffra]